MTPKLLTVTTALFLISLSALNSIAFADTPATGPSPCGGVSDSKSKDGDNHGGTTTTTTTTPAGSANGGGHP